MRTLLPFSLVVAAACAGEPAEVYVAGPGFRESLAVNTSRGLAPSVMAGEGLVLYASRRAGPWRLVARDSVTRGDCYFAAPPPAEEPEVSASLRWIAKPDSGVLFNVEYRSDNTREVRFPAAGQYVLTSESTWCGERYTGAPIPVTVTAR